MQDNDLNELDILGDKLMLMCIKLDAKSASFKNNMYTFYCQNGEIYKFSKKDLQRMLENAKVKK